MGLRGKSPAVTAQQRINCYGEIYAQADRTKFALHGTPGKTLFSDLGASPSRGTWPVDTLATPVFFTVNAGTLYSVNNAGTATVIGTINTTSGDVSMADDGTYLVLVDGSDGWVYNMITPAGLNEITDGNFTTTPTTVAWQDTYFIVSSAAASKQYQLSSPGDPTTWPAVNINFAGAGSGKLQAVISEHSIVELFGDFYVEFWTLTNSPDFPLSRIPGSSQKYGLAARWSIFEYDNSIAGLFKNRMGEVNMSRMSGFGLTRLSNPELESLINLYADKADCSGYGYMLGGHPMALFNFPTADKSWLYDGMMQEWTELQDANGDRDWGHKYCNFINQRLVTDYRNGKIYKLDPNVYTNNGDVLPMEVTSRHVWNDDKSVGIQQVQVDIQGGVGLATGQGSNPQIMLFVSKDGGNTFVPTAWASMGKVGEYTHRAIWRNLGESKDWVLRLRITDPVKRVITGASAEIIGGSF